MGRLRGKSLELGHTVITGERWGGARGKHQAGQVKRCGGDQGPTIKKNSSRDPRAMARASSPSPLLCLPLLLVVIAAVFASLPVAACAGSSNDAAGDVTGSRRMPAPQAQKELQGEEGAPSQRRGFTVGQTTPIPRFASRQHHSEPRRRSNTLRAVSSCY